MESTELDRTPGSLFEQMQHDAVELACSVMKSSNMEKDIATHLKKAFDAKYGSTWHCIVGKNYGSYITHEDNSFIYFYIGQTAVLLFKSN